MHGTIFALVMIAMTGTTVAVLKVFGKRPDRPAVLGGALIMGATFLVLAFVAFGHACPRGGPFGVVVFGSVSAGAARATIETKSVRRWMWTSWFMLTLWGMSLCHLDGYIGNPVYGRRLAQGPQDELRYVQDLLQNAPESQKSLHLPEGWIEQSWRTSTGADFPAPAVCLSGVLGAYWHSWFTGVFSLETYHCGIWCPGGPLKNCSETIEIRPRQREI